MADVSWGHGDVANSPAAIDLLDPVRVALSPTSVQLGVGDNVQIEATAYYSDGSTRDVTLLGSWASDDETVAVSSSTGLVSAESTGTASISFVYGTSSSRASVEVVSSENPSDDDLWWLIT